MTFRPRHLWGWVLISGWVAGTLAATTPATQPTTLPASRPAHTQPAASQPVVKEPWVSKPTAQWPLMFLSHDLLLKDKRTLHGASASLVQLPDGRIVAATARHLIGEAGGFDPPLKIDTLDKVVAHWSLRPRLGTTNAVILNKLLTKPDSDPGVDCLALAVAKTDHYAALVLKIRTEPLKPGDKVCLLGVPYDEPKVRQNAYRGTVTQLQGNTIDFTLETGLATGGFSGAPVIDDKGHFVGIYVGHNTQSQTSPNHFTGLVMVSAQAFVDSIAHK